MILAILPARPGEPPPARLPAALLPLLGTPGHAVVLLARADLAPGSDPRPLALVSARAGLRPEIIAAGLVALPPERVPLLHLAGLAPDEAVAAIRAAGEAIARRDRRPAALLVAGQDEDVATLANALADACLVRGVGLSAADRKRVAARIRRRAALLRWLGPNRVLRGANAVLRRLRGRLQR
jgi:hypothetical protein